ncbi:MAG: hypothetical protein AAGA44_14715 [Pseudomonadota bacterium]
MNRYLLTLVFLITSVTQSLAGELPRVSDCEKPVYALDNSSSDPELTLEHGVLAFKECLLHLIDSHEQSPTGDQSEIQMARRAIEKTSLDIQALFPRTDVVSAANESGLWTEDRKAAAVVVETKAGNVFVVLETGREQYLVANVSPIVSGLFAKLGTTTSRLRKVRCRAGEMVESDGVYSRS